MAGGQKGSIANPEVLSVCHIAIPAVFVYNKRKQRRNRCLRKGAGDCGRRAADGSKYFGNGDGTVKINPLD